MINRDSQVSEQGISPVLVKPLIDNQQAKDAPLAPKQAAKERLQSLDVYRGLTIIGMAMVDHVDGFDDAFWWIKHPKWNGISLGDLVFPSFLFIMGVAIPLAVSKSRPIRPKNVTRVFLLFLIGLFLNLISQQFDFANLRILGILQRMSICYGIVLLIHWWTDYGTHELKNRIGSFIMVAFLIAYVSLMLSWEDPSIGCYKSNNLDPYCNFAGYVDRAVFTQAHILEKTDPEGLISTLTATVVTYVGYCFGLMLLKLKKDLNRLIKYWLLVALICLLPIYPFHLFMPFNKRLFTLTFLVTVLSSSATILTFLLVAIDYIPSTVGKQLKIINALIQPFRWLGMNPLAIFIVLQLLTNILDGWIIIDDRTPYSIVYDACFSSWISPGIGTAIYGFIFCIFYTLVAGLLYRFKIFVRL